MPFNRATRAWVYRVAKKDVEFAKQTLLKYALRAAASLLLPDQRDLLIVKDRGKRVVEMM
jgi:hypothetical protein